jgi:hypothetical protein
MGHVRRIAAWERESGTDGEARAFDYIESTMGDGLRDALDPKMRGA